jgi:hypothetical protein
MRNIRLLFILFILFASKLQPQVLLTGSGTYIEDFNTLASTGTSSTVPAGWAFLESGTNADGNYNTGTGSSNIGDTYSFGAASSTERAFGGLRSGTLIPIIGANFTNNTGFTITQVPISYIGEQWRLGAVARADRLDFQYSLDATSLSTGTWTDINSLDFSSPFTSTLGALDGNAAANRTLITFTISSLSISNGSTFWIRWIDFDATGSDDGLAIDDFSIDQTNLPVELSSFTALLQNHAVNLKWQTKTETNNFGFEILRSAKNDNGNWTKIGFVNGHGNSNSPKNYGFMDRSVSNGKYIYRLKQIDTDGKYEYSKEVEVDFGLPKTFSLGQNYPNPFNPTTKINYTLPVETDVQLQLFTVDGELVKSLVNEKQRAGVYTIDFDAGELASGTYIYKLLANDFIQLKKMLLIK